MNNNILILITSPKAAAVFIDIMNNNNFTKNKIQVAAIGVGTGMILKKAKIQPIFQLTKENSAVEFGKMLPLKVRCKLILYIYLINSAMIIFLFIS